MQFAEAGKPTEQQMARAYEALTRRLQHGSDSSRRENLEKMLADLQALATDDARFFADQVRTALKALAN